MVHYYFSKYMYLLVLLLVVFLQENVHVKVVGESIIPPTCSVEGDSSLQGYGQCTGVAGTINCSLALCENSECPNSEPVCKTSPSNSTTTPPMTFCACRQQKSSAAGLRRTPFSFSPLVVVIIVLLAQHYFSFLYVMVLERVVVS
ncbi:unnamed protein product [Cuscuta campestris]|uniref:Uncharacterized protein n=1 Tax=Cuscuta campestris TaxID=132261 RepID=A0A484M6E9_9ASTE|nr:unnamed protein product [Cuscuta campestris]